MTDERDPFLVAIQNSFQSLLDNERYRLVKHRYDREHFGNALVRLEGPIYSLTFIRDRGQALLGIGLVEAGHESYDLAQLVSFLDSSSTWSYRAPDNNNILYSGVDWQVGELRRVVESYKSLLFDPALFREQKDALDRFIYEKYVAPWLKGSPRT